MNMMNFGFEIKVYPNYKYYFWTTTSCSTSVLRVKKKSINDDQHYRVKLI
jgi:hypothetical protein